MDMKLGIILIILNMALPQKLVLVPGAIFRGNMVFDYKKLCRTDSVIKLNTVIYLFIRSQCCYLIPFKSRLI